MPTRKANRLTITMVRNDNLVFIEIQVLPGVPREQQQFIEARIVPSLPPTHLWAIH